MGSRNCVCTSDVRVPPKPKSNWVLPNDSCSLAGLALVVTVAAVLRSSASDPLTQWINQGDWGPENHCVVTGQPSPVQVVPLPFHLCCCWCVVAYGSGGTDYGGDAIDVVDGFQPADGSLLLPAVAM